jgi:hypothetical protein
MGEQSRLSTWPDVTVLNVSDQLHAVAARAPGERRVGIH